MKPIIFVTKLGIYTAIRIAIHHNPRQPPSGHTGHKPHIFVNAAMVADSSNEKNTEFTQDRPVLVHKGSQPTSNTAVGSQDTQKFWSYHPTRQAPGAFKLGAPIEIPHYI